MGSPVLGDSLEPPLRDGSARTDAIGVSAFDDTSLFRVYSMNVDEDANL